jgi:hypothetical protein
MLGKFVFSLLELIKGKKKKPRKKTFNCHICEHLSIRFVSSHRVSVALAKCIEEGVNHLWTVSAIQMHPKGLIVCDEDSTLELRVKVSMTGPPGFKHRSLVIYNVFLIDCQILQINRTCSPIFDWQREFGFARRSTVRRV